MLPLSFLARAAFLLEKTGERGREAAVMVVVWNRETRRPSGMGPLPAIGFVVLCIIISPLPLLAPDFFRSILSLSVSLSILSSLLDIVERGGRVITRVSDRERMDVRRID